MKYRLGVDVGGTNTDAVILDEKRNVLAAVKYPTSEDIRSGIGGAIHNAVKASGIDPSLIHQAMLGTTQCTNAIVERKHLTKIGILRIGAPTSLGIPPMTDWPDGFDSIAEEICMIKGGFEYNGKEIAPFDRNAAAAFFNRMKDAHIPSIAISCVFATVRDDHEKEAEKLCHEIMGNDVHVTLSSQIGSMGLIERENAAILNAALYDVAKRFTQGFLDSLQQEGITHARAYLSQNDGTLMDIEQARKYPILTVACGPTNSIRGAGYLSNLPNALVLDVGGTTTDAGMIQNGFPRESGIAVTIGGIRTNFRMPDVVSIGLGGGSIVRTRDDGTVTVGPDSVGWQIATKAMVFGGSVMTATDIAVRLGMASIGRKELVRDIPEDTARKAMAIIREKAEDAIDDMKVSSDPVDVILAGGGSIILPETLNGARNVIKPACFGCANAIGAAIAKVAGTCEKLVDYNKTPREQAMAIAREEARTNAIKAGADPDTVEIVEAEDIPLQYYPGNTCRIKVKAAGDLRN
ncbi:hydantoinase/oxoprolinase family protein [Stecheria sp. CLA-KB-P133]|uniref:Hydantoinase/oxoprolinase family protein n=1 Tax=Grylomicrobium aquisgranensis TaxID=2926318 RepID=A0AB35U521_9FIRM|nr:hydantoinase/oxoprolinase family protein [Stecheria sp. CLA-KB-P133]